LSLVGKVEKTGDKNPSLKTYVSLLAFNPFLELANGGDVVLLTHTPVMLTEVLEFLTPKPGERFVDATVGTGAHSSAILERIIPGGLLVGLDHDGRILPLARANFIERGFPQDAWRLFHLSYLDIDRAIEEAGLSETGLHGILFDLGVASPQVDDAGRGFSFKKDGPLDLRYDTTQTLTGRVIVNRWSEPELRRIFKEYADERNARAIAKRICKERKKTPIETTAQLAEIVRSAIPPRFRTTRRDPATLVFQALRITVNDELNTLQTALPNALRYLMVGGACVVISYHSGEDRIVKRYFANASKSPDGQPEFERLTRKPVLPSEAEVKQNRRARSAKLRALRRLRGDSS